MGRARKHRVRITLTLSALANKALRHMAKQKGEELSQVAETAILEHFHVGQLGQKLLDKMKANPSAFVAGIEK